MGQRGFGLQAQRRLHEHAMPLFIRHTKRYMDEMCRNPRSVRRLKSRHHLTSFTDAETARIRHTDKSDNQLV